MIEFVSKNIVFRKICEFETRFHFVVIRHVWIFDFRNFVRFEQISQSFFWNFFLKFSFSKTQTILNSRFSTKFEWSIRYFNEKMFDSTNFNEIYNTNRIYFSFSNCSSIKTNDQWTRRHANINFFFKTIFFDCFRKNWISTIDENDI